MIGFSICLGVLLVLSLLIWAPTLPTWAKYAIGILGIGTSAGSHGFMLYDIVVCESDPGSCFFFW